MKQILNLAGLWKLRFDGDRQGEILDWSKIMPEDCEQMYLPGCWNEAFPKRKLYDGPVWFFKEIWLSKELAPYRAEIAFEGVGHACSVWINGIFCGEHEGGFTSFFMPLGNTVKYGALNYIVIRVDSELSDRTIPPRGVDWFNFGGVYRDFLLVFRDTASIRDYRLSTNNSGSVSIRMQIDADEKTSAKVITVQLKDQKGLPVLFEEFVREETDLELCFKIENPQLWFPGKPYLYTLELSLQGTDGREYDHVTKRFGFREFSVSGNRILINGKDFRLTGCAKHEDYPLTGRTVSKEQLQKDYSMLQQMGANIVRLSHYPHDRKELEILDELGIAAICEAPIVFLKASQMNDQIIQKKCRMMIQELIRDDGNFTCVMFWSLFIECETFLPEARDCVKDLVEFTKNLDSSRLVIMASNRPKKDDSYDLFDVVGINYWSGWYGGESITDADAFFEWMVHKYPQKPLFITSNGYEGLYGKHDRSALTPWSEEAQSDYLTSISDIYMNYPAINGEIIWTFSDFRVSNWNDISTTENDNIYLGRPMLFNHKGVVCHDRTPKLVYFQMKEQFQKWQELVSFSGTPVVKCSDPCLSAAYDFLFSVSRKIGNHKIRIWVTWNRRIRRFFDLLEKNSPIIPWSRIELLQFDGVIINGENLWEKELSEWCGRLSGSPELVPIDSCIWHQAAAQKADYAFLPVNGSGEFGFLDSMDLERSETLLHISDDSDERRRILWESEIPEADDLDIVTAKASVLNETEYICGIMNSVHRETPYEDLPAAFFPKRYSRIYIASD